MKFTKDTIRQLIAEEIENYLNEQDDSDPIDIQAPYERSGSQSVS